MENIGNPFFQAIGQASENKRIEELKAELEGLGFKVSPIKVKKNSTATLDRPSVHISMKEKDCRALGIMGVNKPLGSDKYTSKLGETVSFDGETWTGGFNSLNKAKNFAVTVDGYTPGATLCEVFYFLGDSSPKITPVEVEEDSIEEDLSTETVEGDSVEENSIVEDSSPEYTAQDLGLEVEGDATVEEDSSPAPIEEDLSMVEDPYVSEFYKAVEKDSPKPAARKKSVLNKK